MNYGKREAVQRDRRKKIGFMRPNNCDPVPTPPDAFAERRCPKCGEETEPIEAGIEGLAVQELQLCPNCYLVTWTDQDGPHVRQGIPVDDQLSEPDASASGWLPGEPEEC